MVTKVTLKSSSSGLSVPAAKPPSNILTPSNDQSLIESLPLPAKPAPKPPTSNLDQPPSAKPPKVPERPKHTLIGKRFTPTERTCLLYKQLFTDTSSFFRIYKAVAVESTSPYSTSKGSQIYDPTFNIFKWKGHLIQSYF